MVDFTVLKPCEVVLGTHTRVALIVEQGMLVQPMVEKDAKACAS
jgi:hypothetical protein